MTSFNYEELPKRLIVSRETINLLESYTGLLKKWQKTINLVSASTIDNIWHRHILDSLQLMEYIDVNQSIIDAGSGAGLPGMVLAIAGIKEVTLVESDRRKAIFLKEAARLAPGKITILNQRIEELAVPDHTVITARAFAPLIHIFSMLESTLNVTHSLLLLKGKHYKDEIAEAQRDWDFRYFITPSITDSEAAVIRIESCQKRERS